MITTSKILQLLDLAGEMNRLEVECNLMPDLKSECGLPVKDEEGILESLEMQYELINEIFEKDELSQIKKSIKKWINYFGKEYADEDKILSLKPFYLDKEDAEELAIDIDEWQNILGAYLNEQNTTILKDGSFEDFISSKIVNVFDKKITDDLRDGFEILTNGLPTPAAMLFFRALEAIVKQYYEKISGGKPSKLSWNEMLIEIENKNHMKKSLLGYLHYLRTKRNEIMHPGKRLTQSEGEQIFIQIKGLIDEIKQN